MGWLLATLALLVAAAPSDAWAQTPPDSRATFGAAPAAQPSFGQCAEVGDEDELRQELIDHARQTMRAAAVGIDYEAIVLNSWDAVRFDVKFARIVEDKIEILRADRPYVERLLDGNIPSRAEEMATRAAELVFESPEFKALQDELQADIGGRLEPLVADADVATQTEAAECVQVFLGARYARTVQQAFSNDLGEAAAASVSAPGVTASVALNLAGVIAAILTVAFRRLVRRIVASVVRRLAGAIAARLAAWASVVLGVAFLIYELIAGADGVFPVIQEELTSDATRVEIQTALIDELSTVGPEQLEMRAETIAATMFSRWRGFKDDHRSVLELAEREPAFKAFLADQPPARFEALSAVVATLKRRGGDPAVMDALSRGVLAEAVALPNIASHLEDWSPQGVSIEELLDWSRLAGPDFPQALALGLPALTTPAEIDRETLAAILALDERGAAQVAAALTGDDRTDYLALEPAAARALSARFERETIADLMTLLRPVRSTVARATLIEQAAAAPEAARRAAGAASAVADSRSPDLAASILLDPSPAWSPVVLIRAGNAVIDGQVSPLVLPYRYGWWLVLILGPPALILLGIMRNIVRLFRPRRRRSEGA